MKISKSILALVVVFSLTLAAFAQSSYSNASGASAGLGLAMLSIMGVVYCLMGLFILLSIVLGVASVVLWIYMMIDVFMRDFGDDNNMLVVWLLILIFAGAPVGMVLYYILVMQKYPLKK